MPVTSAKNTPLGPAAQDLGLGDMLNQQLQDQEEERKKKLLAQAQQASRGLGNNMNGLAAQSLLGSGGYG